MTLEKALLALGRLDGRSMLLPDRGLFLYSYVRKEAVLSSQIEGTQSSLSDLILFELNGVYEVPMDDVTEVSNYVRAMEHGLRRMREGFPLSNRLIREIHGELLALGRGSDKSPGEFRRSQNWIGGNRPGTAHFVPPPPHAVLDCMQDLEQFMHTENTGIPALVRAGISHVKFETIHPFLDGNGRVGRLLITLLLCHAKIVQEPLLYLSLYFKDRREDYYNLLDGVRRNGEWEEWLTFFLEGVAATATEATTTAERILALFGQDEARIQQEGRTAGSALQVHKVLKERPITSLKEVTTRTGLSFAAASSAMTILESLGVAVELTGHQRNRRFGYPEYMAILNEGTEPL